MKFFVNLLILVVVLVTTATGRALALDDLQAELLRSQTLPLRWYDAGDKPLLQGETSRLSSKDARHIFRLAPSEDLVIWLSPWEMARIEGIDGPFATGELEVSCSSGGGLYRVVDPVYSDDGRSAVVAPNSPVPLLLKVALLPGGRSSRRIALYQSVREPLGEIAPYRHLLPLPLEMSEVGRPNGQRADRFWRMPAGKPVTVTVKGPVRMALESRLQYPPQEQKRRQLYRIFVSVGDKPPIPLECVTAGEYEPESALDETGGYLARLQKNFIELPEGEHRVTLESTATVLVRLLRRQEPDYLLWQQNAPDTTAEDIRRLGKATLPESSFLVVSDSLLQKEETAPQQLQRQADNLAHDVYRRDGGTVSVAMLRNEGRKRPDYPALRKRAEEQAGFHTFYQELFPLQQPAGGQQAFRWFGFASLKEEERRPTGTAYARQHIRELANTLAGATLTPLAGDGELFYQLPEQSAPLSLRIITAPGDSQGEILELLPSGAQPIRFSVARPPVVPPEQSGWGGAEVGLFLLGRQHALMSPVTMSGAFGAEKYPAPLLRGDVARFELPASVRSFRLRRLDGGEIPLLVAVQLRASLPYTSSESEYLARHVAEQLPQDNFANFMRVLHQPDNLGDQNSAPLTSTPEVKRYESDMGYLPLVRMIRGLEQSYTANVAPPVTAVASAAESGSAALAAVVRAERAVGRGEWLNALESWGEVLNQGQVSAETRRTALMGRMRALAELNEQHLLELNLKGLLLHDHDPEVRKAAYSLMVARYERNSDLDGLLALKATMLLKSGDSGYLFGMALNYLQTGEIDAARQALLLLPPDMQQRQSVLQAAYLAGWWRVFEKTLAAGDDRAERSFWQGLRQMGNGDYAAGLGLFDESGEQGGKWRSHLQEGLKIRGMLQQGSVQDQTIYDWEKWQEQHPGPRSWRGEPEAIISSAGAVDLVSIPRNLHFPAFSSSNGEPVVARLAGPVKVRIEARTLHPVGLNLPLDGWLQVDDGAARHLLPIIGNLPAQGVVITGDRATVPGQKVIMELDLGAGLHTLQISGKTLALLVRLETFRPTIASPALPILTPEVMETALAGGFALGKECPGDNKDLAEIIMLSPPEGETAPERLQFRSCLPENRVAIGRTESLLLSNSLQGRRLLSKVESAVEKQALLLGADDIEGALAMLTDRNASDLLKRAHLLLWLAEQQPDQYLRALAELRVLAAENPDLKGVASIVNRAGRKGVWAPLTTIISGAGVRALEVTGWQPETQAMRVRKSFIAPLAAHENLLYDGGHLVLSMHNLEPVRLDITLQAEDMNFQDRLPLEITVALTGGREERIRLSATERFRSTSVTVPAGSHGVRVAMHYRYLDQSVRVGFKEAQLARVVEKGKKRQTSKGSVERPPRPVVMTRRSERLYQVATQKEPVKILIAGPNVLRIDEPGADGGVTVSYRLIAPGSQTIAFAPEAGSPERLLRFFIQAKTDVKPSPLPRITEIQYTPVPMPRRTADLPPAATMVRLSDKFPLGRQEDGTWTLNTTLASRHSSDDESTRTGERYAQFSGDYRYYNGINRYYKAGLLGRLREYGGPALGSFGQITGMDASLPFTWRTKGSLYLQSPAGTTSDPFRGGLEAAAMLQGEISQRRELAPTLWHRPSLELFGRYITLGHVGKTFAKAVDQDIFTSYREQHQYGITIADQWYWRPWLDTMLSAGGELTSNELLDLRPDNLALIIGWRQLIGPARIDLLNRTSWYIDDRDRQGNTLRNRTGLELVWERWLDNLDRLEVGLGLNLQAPSGDVTGFLSMSWYFGAGRMYLDFTPGEVDFLDLRRRMIPAAPNNVVLYE